MTEVFCAWRKSGARGQQRHGAVCAQIQALKKHVPERVIAGQIEHRFLAKDQQAVQIVGLHCGTGFLAARRKFLR